MRLAVIAATSIAISSTAKRLTKIRLLAELLRQLDPEETEIVVAFLSGGVRQGRIGIGYATIRDATSPPSETPSLEVLEADRAFDALARVTGSGSNRQRLELLQNMFARATAPEQQFLRALLTGELRQGAL